MSISDYLQTWFGVHLKFLFQTIVILLGRCLWEFSKPTILFFDVSAVVDIWNGVGATFSVPFMPQLSGGDNFYFFFFLFWSFQFLKELDLFDTCVFVFPEMRGSRT